jgi:tetratricopeptide (TPR) repeat protein
MKVSKLILFLAVSSCLVRNQNSLAQSAVKDTKIQYMQAVEMFNYEYYNDALSMFLKLLATDKQNCNLNFYVGVCYLKSDKARTMAVPYLLKAVKKVDPDYNYSYKEVSAPVHAYMFLGEALMLDNKFDDAIRNFNTFKTFLTDKPKDVELLEDCNHQIEIANNAKEFMSKPLKNVTIKSFDLVNSTYSDYACIPSLDGNKIYFTSKRKGNTGSEQDPIGGYFDDIYFIQFKDNRWSKPKKIPGKINTSNLEVLGCFSADQKRMYFYRLTHEFFDIYYSDLTGKEGKGKWSNPKKVTGGVNGKENETSCSISHDGSTFYFVSDKPGGYGGTDIYMCEKMSSGEWGPPRNLGENINTKYDEDYPFISSDGATLYFSSKGHKNMGGFDIFYSTISEDGIWSEPENIGYPINTPADDVSFWLSPDGKTGYYSTAKKGVMGELDVFKIDFSSPK